MSDPDATPIPPRPACDPEHGCTTQQRIGPARARPIPNVGELQARLAAVQGVVNDALLRRDEVGAIASRTRYAYAQALETLGTDRKTARAAAGLLEEA